MSHLPTITDTTGTTGRMNSNNPSDANISTNATTSNTNPAGTEHSHIETSEVRPRRRSSRRSVRVSQPHLSSTEVIYPDPDSAHLAFEQERANNPRHRRAPTPHTSKRRNSGTSSRSPARAHSASSTDSDDTLGIPSRVGTWEPHFGAARGVGPAGEAIEVIGLGRKEPRHRKYAPHLLEPALRSSLGFQRHRRDARESRDKPLPRRPASYFAPREYRETPGLAHTKQPFHVRSNSKPLLRSLFSSLSIDAPPNGTSFGRRDTQLELITPADDLFTYLRIVDIPPWTAWQGERDRPVSSLSFFSSRGQKGHDSMPWAWHLRAEAAEALRQGGGRSLMSWEATGRQWERKLLEWIDDNVPNEPIDPANRWGTQTFALPAQGFETTEFFDEAADGADDSGLLSWLIGSVLQTVVPALHMLRYSSQMFTFHLIPSSSPSPYPSNQHALWDGIGTLALVNKANEVDRAMIIEVRPPSIYSSAVLREFAKSSRSEGWWHLPSQYCVGDAGQANLLQAQVYDSCVQNGVFFFAVTNTKQWVFGHFNANYTKCWVGGVVDRKMKDPNVMQCLTAWSIRAVDERPRTSATSPDEGLIRADSRARSAGNPRTLPRPHYDRSTRYEERQLGSEPDRPRYHTPVLASEPPSPLPPSNHQQPYQPYPQSYPQSYPQPYSQPYPQSFPQSYAQPYSQSRSPQPGHPHHSYPIPSSSPMGEFGQYDTLPGYYDLHPQMSSPPPPFSPGTGYNTWNGGSHGMQIGQGAPQGNYSPMQQGYGSMGYFSGYGWPGAR